MCFGLFFLRPSPTLRPSATLFFLRPWLLPYLYIQPHGRRKRLFIIVLHSVVTIMSSLSNVGDNNVFGTPASSQNGGAVAADLSNVTMSRCVVHTHQAESRRRRRFRNQVNLHEVGAEDLEPEFRAEILRHCLNVVYPRSRVERMTRQMLSMIFFDYLTTFIERRVDVVDICMRETPTIPLIIARYGDNWDESNSDLRPVEREIIYVFFCRNAY